MSYTELAEKILTSVGGSEKVAAITHCITRLRFNLKDDRKADLEATKAIQGVSGVVIKGGQYQVVIGPHVAEVYDEVLKVGNLEGSGTVEADASEEPEKKEGVVARALDVISAIFIPIVSPLAGAGMLKAILTVCVTMGWVSKDSQTYTLLYMIADIVFYYLPFFIAVSAAKKLKANPFLALIFAGMLVHPTFLGLKAEGVPVHLLGMPVRMATYTTSVVPIILIVWFQSYVEKFAKKISPNVVKVFLVPLLTILIVAPVGLIVLGPIGAILGDYLAKGFSFLDEKASFLVPMLVGCFFPLLVMTGMHYGLGAVQAAQRAAVGYGTILTPGSLSSNMATAGACAAVALRAKDKDLKALASSCSVTALYGINLKLKRPLYATMIGGAAAGLYAGITGIKTWSSGTSNIFSLPIYIGGDSMSGFYNAIITVVVGLVVSFIASWLLYKEPEKDAA
ncbi:PTS transporter subunit EIIC [Galactobacillus timonensis]|uniref:PTS transporter subunit EIIC n=1 Tax=Galactobacillus timonensis TaxID=2041840 RepID=UPI0023F57641|nr:PTS transporter subunit EIIC [Galactobacillus timonensis]MCI6754887.1 PTS transporter subunit EIIC [Galactobacillus timonensis]